jgi:hypothetical protein
MKTPNFTIPATRIATFLAIFGLIAFAGETTWAQKGTGGGKSASHQQTASKSKQANNTTAVRSRGTQAGQGNQIVAGNFIGTNQLNNKEPDWLSYEPLGLSGQDQETGEIIVFGQRRASSLSSPARPKSLVESEGWDEVPEGLMFQSRSGSGSGIGRTDAIAKSKLGEASMSYLGGSATGHNGILHNAMGQDIVSPRDPASGQATGKRK